ncbi:MAG: 2-C-methyl-D-erythritol 4-phosphate cytidylyltransferase [Chitinophagaceae bacterium]
MNKYALIVAGGSGIRMGAGVPKQFLMLRNKPLLWYPVTAFMEAFPDIWVILVLPEKYIDKGKAIIESTSLPQRVTTVSGGATRFESVKNGLMHVPAGSVVFVHDGVRSLVTPALIQRCYEATLAKGNAVPSVSAIDTIRMETINGNERVDRTNVKIIQTPQAFFSENLKKAYQQEYKDWFTDDASVAENAGEKINLVEGDYTNIKITRQIDLVIAEQLLRQREVSG